jgi:hypothetical protein
MLMTTEERLFRDVLVLLRQQLRPDVLDHLALLAIEDPTMFITEIVSSVKAEHLYLPDPLLQPLKERLYRSMTTVDPHGSHVAAPSPAHLDLDLVGIRQRQVDDLAERVRERNRRPRSVSRRSARNA